MKTAVTGLVLVLFLGACGGDDGDDDDLLPPPTEPTAGEVGTLSTAFDRGVVELTAAPDPPVAGEGVSWSFAITNTSEDPLTLTFPSGQRADVVLTDDGGEVYRWSEGRAFSQALEELTIDVDETVTFELDGTIDVGPGTYELVAALTADPAPAPIEDSIVVEAGD